MTTTRIKTLAAALFALAPLALGTSALAQRGAPASLLVFPEYDTSGGVFDLLTVTNTSATQTVNVEWIFIDGDTCQEFNRTETLTPGDTFSALTRFYNPAPNSRGFVYAVAMDPNQFGTPIAFDHLIGTSTAFDGGGATSSAFDPWTFRAMQAEGEPTDLDGDGRRDLDGLEYAQGPDRCVIPTFYGQEAGVLESELILINLSGTVEFLATVDFLVYNDNEEVFSAEHSFQCWESILLTDVSQLFSNQFLQVTNHDPNEIVGATFRESGWFVLDGAFAQSNVDSILDPLILAALAGRGELSYGLMPFRLGTQDNGDLINRSLFDDNFALPDRGRMSGAGSVKTP